jgi:quercetin dioxygenase-like cupin family protein
LSEREVVRAQLSPAIDDLQREGFRLDCIYPADDPHSAVLSRDGEMLRLTSRPGAERPAQMPPFASEFVLTQAADEAAAGRAGMHYRDLIPGRLGGRYIASHITIPGGGPVADWVHYHRIALQLIVVRRGWVRVVYEDQGEPFVMREGDLVVQPPLIRHRVLESSPGLEVIEVSAPALHATFADHELVLPNGTPRTHDFAGQRFLHQRAAETPWTGFAGGEAQETRVREATRGLADVRTIRSAGASRSEFDPHQGELVFGFVLGGSATLERNGVHALGPADAFVIPPQESWVLFAMSSDFQLLHVTTDRLD